MNTALNFLSVPKDSATTESLDKPTGVHSGIAAERQDLADGGEKNASFANVLKEERSQSTDKTALNSASQKADSQSDAASNKASSGDAVAKADGTPATESAQSTHANAVAATEEQADSEALDSLLQLGQTKADTSDTTEQSDEASERAQLNLESSLVLRESIARVLRGETAVASRPVGSEQVADEAVSETGAPTQSALAATDSLSTNKTTTTETDVAELASANTSASSASNATTLTATQADSLPGNLTVADTDMNASQRASGPQLQDTISLTARHASDSNAQPVAETQGQRAPQDAHLKTESLTTAHLATADGDAAAKQNQQSALSTGTSPRTGSSPEAAVAASVNPELNKQIKTNSDSITASLESFPAAGKPLPPTGKSLPAGLFFQGEGESPTLVRSEQAQQATAPIDLNNAFNSKHGTASQAGFDKGIEFNADKLTRSLLNTTNVTGESTSVVPPTPATVDSSTSAAALLNPLLQVTADKALQAARPALSLGGEPALTLNIAAQAGSAEWQSQLSGRIRWMGNLNISSAELKLHPAELGAVEIQITTEDDQTRVSFITSNAAAKEVIESTLPRLRELLGEGGLQLEQGDVAQRDLSEEKQARDLLTGERAEMEDGEEGEQQQANVHFTRQSTSQIDHYV